MQTEFKYNILYLVVFLSIKQFADSLPLYINAIRSQTLTIGGPDSLRNL